ncbi:twitching motility protein PilT [Ectothiorhodospira magna]|uniref:Twitching motility protein PilT n=1 Tax=Ectothiorhodospira magna TaxID=867345 RepID=A0A1H9BPP1_9GAMM|nr:type IV pilus twitching motility protein PilT [Ectothiorhodospira magna]SEP90681.1 twitching motility protein PilT [Ectothiorhodospira magna]
MHHVDDYLKQLMAAGGSDLHLVSGDPPRIRVHGEIRPIGDTPLQPQDLSHLMGEILSPDARIVFDRDDGVDFAYAIEGVGRFRVNLFRHLHGQAAVFRAIPECALSLSQLNLPMTLAGLGMQRQGLVLVTGKTGSGKSTTLAALVDDINQRRRGHIITIEDPIEFVHHRKRCLISQRQVGVHTKTFAAALRSALREDPDVILVGELRDLDTIALAVTAAETGILVLGTLHTNGAATTVDRIINVFPAMKQPQIRTMLSTSLRGVISQQLVCRADGEGRVLAMEILVNTPAVANLIREGRTDQLLGAMQSGALTGMQTMDTALRRLLDGGFITGREAYLQSINKAEFEAVKTQS